MTVIDISKYVDNGQFVSLADLLERLLRDNGYVRMDDVLNIRVDTVAIAQLHHVCQATLLKYVNDGYIQLGNDRRMTLREVLALDFIELKAQASAARPASRRKR